MIMYYTSGRIYVLFAPCHIYYIVNIYYIYTYIYYIIYQLACNFHMLLLDDNKVNMERKPGKKT